VTPERTSTRTTIDGRQLTVSNLEKVLFPSTGFTKGQLIDYYLRIAPVMLPHLRGRPLTMKRFPDGVEGKSFFEKHIPSHAPDWVRTLSVPAGDGHEPIPYAVVDDVATLAWAANLGNIEFHVPLWHAGRQRTLPARPDMMVFDLDPGEGTSIVECCVVAVHVAEALEQQGMASFAKTSGSKGLQLYASARPRTSWDRHRDLVVSNMRKALRKGRVLIDWSQNHPAKTTVSVYSVRAMPEPLVSTPVSPSEVKACANTRDPRLLRFDTTEVLRRIESHGDLFAALASS